MLTPANVGVNLTGSIVICRYGGIFRGLKVPHYKAPLLQLTNFELIG